LKKSEIPEAALFDVPGELVERHSRFALSNETIRSEQKMITTEICLDEEKIVADGEYTPEQLYGIIDFVMGEVKSQKNGKGKYFSYGNEEETNEGITVQIFTFFDEDWFNKYATKWIAEEDGFIEDVLAIHSEREEINADMI